MRTLKPWRKHKKNCRPRTTEKEIKMTTSTNSSQSQGVPFLSTLMKLQMFTSLIYGVAFFVLPAWTLQTIFSFDQLPPITWPRGIGATFLAIALSEYLCLRHLSARLDEVWYFVAFPGLLMLGLIWDRLAGTYQGSEPFYWVSIAVTAFFFITIGISRLRIKSA